MFKFRRSTVRGRHAAHRPDEFIPCRWACGLLIFGDTESDRALAEALHAEFCAPIVGDIYCLSEFTFTWSGVSPSAEVYVFGAYLGVIPVQASGSVDEFRQACEFWTADYRDACAADAD